MSQRDFATKQSEVFRLCPKHDYSESYSYKGFITEDDNNQLEIKVNTRFIPTENRLKFDIDGRKNKYKHPVIYIGLKRLFPNADEVKFNTEEIEISSAEKKFYIDEIKNIMVINGNGNDVEE